MNREYLERIQNQAELWDNFTRKEEYNPEFRDQHDRFSYYLSKTRDIFKPDVSQFLMDSGYKPEYPDGKKFAVCLTHDIDIVFRSIPERRYLVAKNLCRLDKNGLSVSIKGALNKRYPLCNFEEIMDLEEKYNAKSSFYFLALQPGDLDYSYDVMDLKDDLRIIRSRGCEVGLHGGHEAYNSYDRISDEKKRLENVLGTTIVGYRNHYLRFRTPDTWEHIANAGFLYDTTLGYADCIGFRNGMCHPFMPYNLNSGSIIDILEIPLVVMDGTIFSDYMRLSSDVALDCVKRLIDRVEECRGVFTLLWHNSMFLDGTTEKKMYIKILEYCYEKNAWITSGEEIEHNFRYMRNR
ncbi:polysaccharide deacetylase family protein [Methanogenium organophilum]|uniref:Polysaccharide deacetylase family protein n=1 Tax=Methanogenium organophilum TaxID=2199 RepID=A0A9X9S490_METOG|nr:polysaccharide deacetylase family protein [Methanogenium organophilum]WAI01198.1 polysaccharide deacetylase family protein [Methanogenium organophilum]